MAVKEHFEDIVRAKFKELRQKITEKKWLTNDDIIFLQREYKGGNGTSTEARNIVIEGMGDLLYKMASLYAGPDYADDLAHEGVFGITEALDRYKPSRGKFITYSFYWIRRSMLNHIIKNRMIRTPNYLFYNTGRVIKYIKGYVEQNHDFPSNEQISDATGISLERVANARSMPLLNPVSLDESVTDDGTPLVELQADHDMPSAEPVFLNYGRLLKNLKPQQRLAVTYRHGLDNGGKLRTFREVASMMEKECPSMDGRSTIRRQRAEQIYKKGLNELKRAIVGNVYEDSEI